MTPGQEDELRLAERAAQWYGLLQESDVAQTAFFNWLAESPRHVDELLSTLVLAQEIAELTPDQHARVESMAATETEPTVAPAVVVTFASRSPTESVAVQARPRKSWTWGVGVAATVLLAAAAVWLISNSPDRQTYTTAIGEQRVLELADGSIVHLNTHSRLEIHYTHNLRSVDLLSGQALFKVEREPARPFLVHSGRTIIQAIGTQFDVYRRSADTRVAVIEGLVEISPSGTISHPAGKVSTIATRPARLAAGEAADIAIDGEILKREPVDLFKTVAWRQRRLVFHEDTLGDIAAEFNRYNPSTRIRVVGEAATNQHFSGTFDADAPETLMQALAGDDTLTVAHSAHEIVVRQR